MIKAGSGYSEDPTFEKAALQAASQALEASGLSRADQLIVFAANRQMSRWPEIAGKLKSLAGTDCIIGSSAFGTLTEKVEIEQHPSLSVMALGGTDGNVSPFLINHLQENNFKAGAETALHLQEKGFDPSGIMILPDAFSFQHGHFFDGFESENESTALLGGCASEQEGKQKTFQWMGDKLAFDSVAGLAFGRNLEIEFGITQSCQPFGEPLRITRSKGNVIFEIDGRPAYDIFLELITQLQLEDAHDAFHRLFLGLPLSSYQTEFARSRYLVRNIMSVNARKGVLSCASHVEEGDYFTFALRDPQRAREDMILMLQDLKEKTAGRRVPFGLYFNCCARGTSLYDSAGEDASLIREFFPEVPVTGFFTFGEIAPIDFVNHLHHYSGILALACEK